jgi:hypothetical protein
MRKRTSILIALAPGGSTGWHGHPDPSMVVVKSGPVTMYVPAHDYEADVAVKASGPLTRERGLGVTRARARRLLPECETGAGADRETADACCSSDATAPLRFAPRRCFCL